MLINLDAIIDTQMLYGLDENICLGIAASSMNIPTPGVTQIGIKNPAEIIRKYNSTPDLYSKISHLTVPQQRLFMKLYEQAFLPATSVYLRNHTSGNYQEKWIADKCEWHDNSKHFPDFIHWIDNSNIFESYGRIEIFMVDAYTPIPLHVDKHPNHMKDDPKEFIWINIRGDKPFWCIDKNGHKHYLSNIAWFDDECMHGADPINWMAYSIRIDGIFTESFKLKIKSLPKQIPQGSGASAISSKWDQNWIDNIYK